MRLFITAIICFSLFITPLFSGEGGEKLFEKVEMDINRDNYILFEKESMILCDRNTDEYLMEITPDIELYVKSDKVYLNDYQQELVEKYYVAQHILFTKRNKIGAKGIRIGVNSAKLAAKAVSGAFMLLVSGFDEEEEMRFEQEMESEAENIEREAEKLEDTTEDYVDQIYVVNKLEKKLRKEIDILNEFDLSVDEGFDTYTIDSSND